MQPTGPGLEPPSGQDLQQCTERYAEKLQPKLAQPRGKH